MSIFPMPGPAGGATPPLGPSPAVPPAQEGLIAQARTKVGEASKLLVDALGMLKTGINSDEGKGILAALKILGPLTPEVSEGLGRSELQSLLASAGAVRQAPPPGMLGTPRPIGMPIAGSAR
jgi:hypothetical protein